MIAVKETRPEEKAGRVRHTCVVLNHRCLACDDLCFGVLVCFGNQWEGGYSAGEVRN